MRNLILILAITFGFVATNGLIVNAGFVVQVGQGTQPFVAGESGTLPVYLYTTDGSGESKSLNNFNLYFDFDSLNSPGGGFPTFFTGFENSEGGAGFSDFSAEVWTGVNFDIGVAGTASSPISLASVTSANPLHLFDLKFDISADANEGIYYVAFRNDAMEGPFNMNNISGAGLNEYSGPFSQVAAGSFEVVTTAAPEPSSMALLGLLAAGGAAYRRMRRKSDKNVQSDASV